MSDPTNEQVESIIRERDAHHARLRAPDRDRASARSDAEFILLHRIGGVSVETLCMMLTDVTFAIREMRAKK